MIQLLAESGPLKGKRWTLPNKGKILLGRGEEAAVPIRRCARRWRVYQFEILNHHARRRPSAEEVQAGEATCSIRRLVSLSQPLYEPLYLAIPP